MKPSIRNPLIRGCVPVGMAALLSLWLLYSTAETDAAHDAALSSDSGSLAASSLPPNPFHAPRGLVFNKANDDTRDVRVRTGTLLTDHPEVAIGRWSEWERSEWKLDDPESDRLTTQARRSVTF